MTNSGEKRRVDVAAVTDVLHEYDTVWLDVQGVLMKGNQPDANAKGFLRTIRDAGKALCMITNQFSASPEDIRETLSRAGLDVQDCPLITPRHVLPNWVQQRKRDDETCAVLGSHSDRLVATCAGLRTMDVGEPVEILLIGHPSFSLDARLLERALFGLLCSIATGLEPTLLIPNPDRLFPKGALASPAAPGTLARPRPQEFGLGPGTAAEIVISTMGRLVGPAALNIQILGKPEALLFDRAKSLAPTGRVLMVGDQLETDIEGANRAGVDSLLLLSEGFHGNTLGTYAGTAKPTYSAKRLI